MYVNLVLHKKFLYKNNKLKIYKIINLIIYKKFIKNL